MTLELGGSLRGSLEINVVRCSNKDLCLVDESTDGVIS